MADRKRQKGGGSTRSARGGAGWMADRDERVRESGCDDGERKKARRYAQGYGGEEGGALRETRRGVCGTIQDVTLSIVVVAGRKAALSN